MINIKSFTLDELVNLATNMGWERYRALQIYQWLWQKNVDSFSEMTNLSKNLRTELATKFYIGRLNALNTAVDADGTMKFTFELEDRNIIESVLIFDRQRRTGCLSTQVGCTLGCRFCATARLGFKRNLRWFEIVEQIHTMLKITKVQLTNIVFMGMGEPLLNLDEVIKAISVINSDYGLRIGARRITVSTAGIPDGIRKIARLPLQIRLAISLNAASDHVRSTLMPINNRYPLNMLLEAAREYVELTGRRLTFEYVLIDGVNDSKTDAEYLIRFLHNIPCKINLIPVNQFSGSEFKSPRLDRVVQFARYLYPHLPAVTIRKSRGSNILAGCGQLAANLKI
ncbi:MAG: 23S rRNA (adenine(2503)-C(2))-methyltransferase RlmN [candidate division WOR-3 bacterium]